MNLDSTHSASEIETILGLDVGGSKTIVVEGTRDAQILQRSEIPTEGARAFEETFQHICELGEQTIAEAAARYFR
jgi:hypothetical protein